MGKRVLIYGINYAPEIAGVGRYTGEIGAHLASLGHQVCVITAPPHYPGWAAKDGYSGARWTREVIDGAEVYRCPLYLHPQMVGFRRLLAPLSFALSSAAVAIWQCLKRRPDVVLVIEPALFAAPAGLLAARLVGARSVLHVQDLEVEAAFAVGHLENSGLAPKLAAWFDARVTRAFDHVVTISSRMAERLRQKGVSPEQIEVVRNWVDLDQIRPLEGVSPYRDELGLGGDRFVALYAGNLGVKQGMRVLIEAARALRERADITFVIAGEGPMRPALEAAARELPNLRLLPFQPEARMSEFLGLADVHVLPQERDAADLLLPSKLGGMLASGRQIVVTADPGTELAEFLGRSCLFTPPGDAAALATAIARLKDTPARAEDKAERLSRAASLSKSTAIARFAAAVLSVDECAPDGLADRGVATPGAPPSGSRASSEARASRTACSWAWPLARTRRWS